MKMKTVNTPLMITAVVVALIIGSPVSAQNCRGVLADPRVQGFAAEVLAQMNSDYASPAAVRESFLQKMEDRAKRDTYRPRRTGRPPSEQPIQLIEIIVGLRYFKPSLIDVWPSSSSRRNHSSGRAAKARRSRRRRVKVLRALSMSCPIAVNPLCETCLKAVTGLGQHSGQQIADFASSVMAANRTPVLRQHR